METLAQRIDNALLQLREVLPEREVKALGQLYKEQFDIITKCYTQLLVYDDLACAYQSINWNEGQEGDNFDEIIEQAHNLMEKIEDSMRLVL